MAEATVQKEDTVVANGFGIVTNRRLVFQRDRGWFSDGFRMDIPLQHVTSVRLEKYRAFFWATLLNFIGLFLLQNPDVHKVFGLILIAWTVPLLWGSPKVVINTAGHDLHSAKGSPWHSGEANSFVEALREQLFKKTSG